MTGKVAILGTGWGTTIQVPVFRHVGLEIAAVWARSEEKAQKMAADLSIPFSSTDYRAVISYADVDVVSVATPPYVHAEMTIAALEAGKHALCEKPMALNTTEAEQMLAAAKARPEQIALIDHQLRFLPVQQKMRSLVQDGYVGEVFHVEGTAWEGSMLNLHTSWHWWHDREGGGGILGAVGSHFIDLVTWVLDRPIRAVNATMGTYVRKRADLVGVVRPVTSDDFFTLYLRFSDGICGVLQGSSVTAGPPVHRLVIAGSAGSLHYEAGQLIGYRANADTSEVLMVEEDLDIPEQLNKTVWVRGLVHFGQALKTAIQTGDCSPLAPAATFADGLYVQRTLAAARLSHEKGSFVEIDEIDAPIERLPFWQHDYPTGN